MYPQATDLTQTFPVSPCAIPVACLPVVYMYWTPAKPAQPKEDKLSAIVQSVELRQQRDSIPLLQTLGIGVNEIYPMLPGRVWQLTMDRRGCRLVQAILEDATTSDAMRSAMAAELHTHVNDAVRSPHGNHVIQKCIEMMRPHDTQFIINEIIQAGTVVVAQHQFGCRILQRMFEHSQPDQLHPIADELLMESVQLCKHIYGSLVIQHLLQHGDKLQSHVSRLLCDLAGNVVSLGSYAYAASVFEKALNHGNEKEQMALVQALIAQPDVLCSMSAWRHGNGAARLALEKAAPQQRNLTLKKIQRRKHKLENSRYGKKLLTCAEALLREEFARGNFVTEE